LVGGCFLVAQGQWEQHRWQLRLHTIQYAIISDYPLTDSRDSFPSLPSPCKVKSVQNCVQTDSQVCYAGIRVSMSRACRAYTLTEYFRGAWKQQRFDCDNRWPTCQGTMPLSELGTQTSRLKKDWLRDTAAEFWKISMILVPYLGTRQTN
jgi:hypothetical protein